MERRDFLRGVIASGAVMSTSFNFTATAQEDSIPVASDKPQRVMAGVTGDPTRGFTISWRLDRLPASPRGEITSNMASPKLEEGARIVPGTAVVSTTWDGDPYAQCEAVFDGLEPGVTYYYRVGSDAGWSPWTAYRTAAAGPEPFRFIYLGDMQNDIASKCTRTVQSAFVQAPDARMVLIAGDLVNEGYDDSQWGELCLSLGNNSARIPILAAPGNHDEHKSPTALNPETVLGPDPLWRSHLAMPLNGPAGIPQFEEGVWRLDYQGVRFISLDANVLANNKYEADKQAAAVAALIPWLEESLATNPNPWTIVIQHHPIYSTGKGRDNIALREALVPLFDKYGVDLVLQGHDHHYGRTHKMAANAIVDPAAPGTIYAVSVSGPKMYDANPAFAPLMAVTRAKTQMFQVIDVSHEKIGYQAYAVNGELVDAFELTQTPDSGVIYKDMAPAPLQTPAITPAQTAPDRTPPVAQPAQPTPESPAPAPVG